MTQAYDASLLEEMGARLGNLFDDMGIAEDEFKKALERHPDSKAVLDEAWPLLLRPPYLKEHPDELYRHHIAELLERAATQGITKTSMNLATTAEVLLAASATSLQAPMSREGAALYFHCFKKVFSDSDNEKVTAMIEEFDKSRAYLPQYDSQIEDDFADAQRRLKQERI